MAIGALPAFKLDSFHEGHLSPVFFGSALRNFCIEDLLNGLAAWVPGPLPRKARLTAERANGEIRTVQPLEHDVSGFVFKVQANMDPQHRDRVAFVRLCSGKFRRGMKLYHVREDRQIAVTQPILFFAQNRETVDDAYAGDIIGVPNHGTLRVGDTLTEKEPLRFEGIPNFAPEILRRITIDDAMKMKQLNRALDDLAEEGVVQVFHPLLGSRPILGVVGALQLDVLASRLRAEYGVPISYESAPCDAARWVFVGHGRGCRRLRRSQPQLDGPRPRRCTGLSSRKRLEAPPHDGEQPRPAVLSGAGTGVRVRVRVRVRRRSNGG